MGAGGPKPYFFLIWAILNWQITNSPFLGVGRSMKVWAVVEYTSAMLTGKKYLNYQILKAGAPNEVFPKMSYIKTENHKFSYFPCR